MKRTVRLIAVVSALSVMVALMMGGVASAQTTTPVVYFNPTNSLVNIGTQTTVEVWVNNAVNFYGIEFEMTYDPAIAEASSVVEGPAFTAWPNEYEVVQANAGGGVVQFAASLLATTKAPPLNGNLHVATITFDALAQGTTPLTWTKIKLSNNVASPITYSSLDGTLRVVWFGNAQGYAYLEGRTNRSGTTVDLNGSSIATTTTASTGWYQFLNVISGGGYNLYFEHDLYLDAELTGCTIAGGTTTTLPSVTLLGGDLNGDGEIDILDLSYCAARFNTADATADITANGIVDIYDVVLIGKNFGVIGPVSQACP
jgi:hypothetical protein